MDSDTVVESLMRMGKESLNPSENRRTEEISADDARALYYDTLDDVKVTKILDAVRLAAMSGRRRYGITISNPMQVEKLRHLGFVLEPGKRTYYTIKW